MNFLMDFLNEMRGDLCQTTGCHRTATIKIITPDGKALYCQACADLLKSSNEAVKYLILPTGGRVPWDTTQG